MTIDEQVSALMTYAQTLPAVSDNGYVLILQLHTHHRDHPACREALHAVLDRCIDQVPV